LVAKADDSGRSTGQMGRVPCLLTPDMQNGRIITQHLLQAGVEVTPQIEASSIVVPRIRCSTWHEAAHTKNAQRHHNFLSPTVYVIIKHPPD
jgi:hypothetical protein